VDRTTLATPKEKRSSLMKITHVITTIERGGAEKAVLALAISQAKSGHSVCIIPLKGRPELANQFNANQIDVRLDLLNKNPAVQIRILKNLTKDSDIIHSHLPRAELIVRVCLGRGKFLITRHNSETFFPKAPTFFSSIVSRWVTHDSYLIAISKAVHEFLINNKELHRSCKSSVIYYGYQTRRSKNSLAKRYESKSLITLGTISRLTPQKNLHLLLAFAHYQIKNKRNVIFKIVGEGPMQSELQDLALSLDVNKSVSFLGKIENVWEFLESLDFFLLTSNYEGFGLSLLEAFDSNIPVIASNVSAIPEVMGKNHPGLFDCGSLDSLVSVFEELLSSRRLQSRTLELQRARLSFFNMREYFASHELIYCKSRKQLENKSRVYE